MTFLLKYRCVWAIFILGCLGVLLYANSLHSAFHFDDYPYILNNSQIRDLTDWGKIWAAAPTPTRALAYLSFAINYHFHGDDVFGYHLVNMVIHILNACLVLWFASLLQVRFRVAFFAALLFLAHPIQTEAVTYIVQRFTSLVTLFYLLSVCGFLAYRRSNKIIWALIFILAAIAAMLTKQIAITLPFVWLSLEMFFFGSKKCVVPWRWLVLCGVFVGIVPFLSHFQFQEILGRSFPSRSHVGDTINMWTYALTQTQVLWRYLWLWIVPLGQTLDYDWQVSTSLFERGVLFALAGYGLGFVFLVQHFAKNRLFVFSMFWFFLTISVTSSFIPIPQVIFEHRCYLPSVGLCLVSSLWLSKYIHQKVYYILIATIIIGALSYLTIERNKIWKSDVTLWEDIVQKAPSKVRGYNNLGIAYFNQGLFQKAVDQFHQVITMNPNAARAYNNRALAFVAMSEEELALQSYDEAVEVYYQSRDPMTNTTSRKNIWAEMFINRANLRYLKGQMELAKEDYTKALELDRRSEKAHYHLGRLYEDQFNFSQAIAHYQKALELDPRFEEAYQGLGLTYHAQGNHPLAIENFTQAIGLNGNESKHYYYRALSYYQEKNLSAAKMDLMQSMRLGFRPNDVRLKKVYEEILQY